MNSPLTQARLITRPDDLQKLSQHLSQQPILAVDTESNSLFAYQERVCLVQISTPAADYLVDPLAIPDLSPLAPVFASPAIEKVFHAAEYDLICLRRDYGFQFANLFDTMHALRILGRDTLGLGAVLEAEFSITVDKRHQRADWGQRPLPRHLLDYARIDTHYLIELRQRLARDLQAAGRWELAVEDFTRFCQVSEDPPEDPAPTHGIPGGRLPPKNYTVLLQLCSYRDQVAKQLDRPLFKVMGDKTLTAIAEACPATLAELKLLPGMSPRQIDRHGEALLQAVQRGLQAKPVSQPKGRRKDEQFLLRLENLRQWRKEAGRSMGVDSDVVLPRGLLYALAETPPQDAAALQEVMRDLPWRCQRFGAQILQVLNPAG